MTHRIDRASLLALLSLAALVSAAPSAAAERSHRPRNKQLVNIGLDARASGSSQRSEHPAALATDGNAGTSWCPRPGPATLTVDLGRTSHVAGFGLHLAGAAGEVAVRIAGAGANRRFRPVGSAFAVPLGTPSWIPVDRRGLAARHVRLQFEASGVCVAELRVMGQARGGDRREIVIGRGG